MVHATVKVKVVVKEDGCEGGGLRIDNMKSKKIQEELKIKKKVSNIENDNNSRIIESQFLISLYCS